MGRSRSRRWADVRAFDDRNLQCGLSWLIVLRKRDIFRQCFDNFDYDKVAAYGDTDVERILNTEGMIRSPRKIQAVINNARCCQKLRDEFGSLCDYFWSFTGGKRSSIKAMPRERFRSATACRNESAKI